jgi:hypothetical protein
MKGQAWCIIIVVAIRVPRLSVSFLSFEFGLLLGRSWGRGRRVFAFCIGWLGGEGRRRWMMECVKSTLDGRLDFWPGVAEVWRIVRA